MYTILENIICIATIPNYFAIILFAITAEGGPWK
jgi:hypothetical protein